MKKNTSRLVQIISTYLLLGILAFSLTSCSSNIKDESILNNDTSEYISISTTSDYEQPGKSEINFYDNSMKKINTEYINSGGYHTYIEKDNMIYLLGGKSLLKINKNSAEITESSNIIDSGIMELVNVQGDTSIFINNIGVVSKTEYDSEICEILELDNPKVNSFKTDKSLAMDAIKIKDKYYVISRRFDEEKSSRALEIYDNNKILLSKETLDNSHTFYQFYKKNDDLYLIGTFGEFENKILKLNEDGLLSLVDTLEGFTGEIFIDQFKQELYLLNDDGVHQVDIEKKKITTIFDTKDFYKENNDYTINMFFTTNSQALRIIKRSKADVNLEAEVKYFIKSELNEDFKELEDFSANEDSMMVVFLGALN